MDWAALRPTDSASVMEKYGALQFHNALPSLEVLQANFQVASHTINPPETIEGTLVSAIKPGTADTSNIYKKLQENLQKESGATTESIEADVRDVFKIFPYVVINDTHIISGNSGSPVLYEGKVIGIISHSSDDNKFGLMQWIFNINSTLGYPQTLANSELLQAYGF